MKRKGPRKAAHAWVMKNFPEASADEAIRLYMAFEAGADYRRLTFYDSLYQMIQDVVPRYYNMTERQLHRKTRKREIAQARQIVMYFGKKHTTNSLQKLADPYGLDHATALHGINVVKDLIETNKDIRDDIEQIGAIIEDYIVDLKEKEES